MNVNFFFESDSKMQQSRQECVGFREFAMHHYNVGWMHKLQLFKDIFYIIFFCNCTCEKTTYSTEISQTKCVCIATRARGDQEEVSLESEEKKIWTTIKKEH